jgi:hypothetical protein
MSMTSSVGSPPVWSGCKQSNDQTRFSWLRPIREWRLLVQSIHVPAAEQFEIRSETFVQPSATFRLDLEKRAHREGLSVVYCHSHPAVPGVPKFSKADDEAEPPLAVYAHSRVKNVPHVALLIGAEGIRARELGCGRPVEVFEVGRCVVRHFPAIPSAIASAHDRQVRAFGKEGQRAIQALTIAIVGLGGTGSVVAQQLAHLGVRRFLLVDPDKLDKTSLNRVVGAVKSDIGRLKVAIAARTIKRLVRDARVIAVQGDILERKVGVRLKSVDFIFCCTDSDGSRHFLNQLAYQYFVPCIDMGVVITVADGKVTHFNGRVKMLAPSLGCLVCQDGILSPRHVRWDLSNERQRRADPYFSSATGIKQPSVISLNSATASQAITMFLAAVAGIPTNARSQTLRGVQGDMRVLDATPRDDCVNCSAQAFYGKGDAYDLPAQDE